MTTITISDASFTVSGKLVAGDTIFVRLDNVGLQEDARVRLVITAIPPPDARHLVAATGLLSSAKLDTQLLLKSTELRNALKGAHVSEAVPVMIEAIDEAHACVLGSLRYQIENSAALWIGSAQKYPIPDPIYALSEDLKRHEFDRSNPHDVTAAQVGADPSGTAADAVSVHNASKTAHANIRNAVANAKSAAESARAAAQTVAVALSAHKDDTNNPHGVTEAQVAEASGYDNPSNVFLRLYRQDGVDGKFVYDDKLTFYGQVSFPGASAYFNSMVVSNLSLFESGLMVAGGSIYIEDINNKDAFYALFVRDGKLYLDDAPLTRAKVRGLINE